MTLCARLCALLPPGRDGHTAHVRRPRRSRPPCQTCARHIGMFLEGLYSTASCPGIPGLTQLCSAETLTCRRVRAMYAGWHHAPYTSQTHTWTVHAPYGASRQQPCDGKHTEKCPCHCLQGTPMSFGSVRTLAACLSCTRAGDLEARLEGACCATLGPLQQVVIKRTCAWAQPGPA